MVILDPALKEACWEILKRLAPDSISWNHYDLSQFTEISDKETWKQFLMQPDVSDWITEERKILQQYELAKLTTNVAQSRSLGQAQLINAVEKITSKNRDDTQTGPIFIYSYVPLTPAQQSAPNVNILKEDIFLDEPLVFDPSADAPPIFFSPDAEGIPT